MVGSLVRQVNTVDWIVGWGRDHVGRETDRQTDKQTGEDSDQLSYISTHPKVILWEHHHHGPNRLKGLSSGIRALERSRDALDFHQRPFVRL